MTPFHVIFVTCNLNITFARLAVLRFDLLSRVLIALSAFETCSAWETLLKPYVTVSTICSLTSFTNSTLTTRKCLRKRKRSII
uniref:Bm14145 n=1 Tax=Brugia malayi TaxID=6279 RepID=A0A1I9G6V9_BRUMA|nr:Bm14145 [Brugia malayi]